ncbi:MAG: SLATT domain-containing protein [Bacteriovoracaceae bacterium]|nr:SLATT domain-containing protein [Bacteriovoracaceae bacterium]
MKDISLVETIREAFGRVVYTHKTHEVMIDHISTKSSWLNAVEIILIAVSASGIATSIVVKEDWIKVLAAIFSFFSLAISLYKTNLGPEAKMLGHRIAANKLWLIREEYINLISDFSEHRVDVDTAMKQRDSLQKKLKEIYDNSPQLSPCAYKVAQKRLKDAEDFTFSNEELNKFLPKSLAR